MSKIILMSFIGIIISTFILSEAEAETYVVTACAVTGLLSYSLQLFQKKRRAGSDSLIQSEHDEWQLLEKQKLNSEIQALKDEITTSAEQAETQEKVVEELSEKCICVSNGSEITQKLTKIVQEKTEESTLEFTQRVYRVLEISEELNRSIQQVVGALSSETNGSLTQDVELLEDEQQRIEHLIKDFVDIRGGYSSEAERIQRDMNSIGDFVDIIRDLADKTNVLAINASIEAARAGRAGDGFAVIGNEIQKLSHNSKKIAEQIDETIHTSVASVSDSVDQYNEKISNAVNRLEQSGDAYASLISKLRSQIGDMTQIVGISDDLSQQVHGNVDEITVQLQYQDRIKQILDHLLSILADIGTEAKESVKKYMEMKPEDEKTLYTELLKRASCHFTCDEEYTAFGLQDDIGLDDTAPEEKDLAGKVELF